MCGRFAITLPNEAMAQLFSARLSNDLPDTPNYNVCPTNRIHVLTREDGADRRVQAMRWGFVPSWYKALNDGPLLINARAETVAKKPAFSTAVRARRALVPMTGFYEWTKDALGGRDPWFITRRDGAPLVIAAIWQDWTDADGTSLRSCAMLTTAANSAMSVLHSRMPLVLTPDQWPLWLGEEGHGAATLMAPAPEDALQWHRVSRAVNSNRASGDQLVAPVDAA